MITIRESVRGVKEGDVFGSRTVIGPAFTIGKRFVSTRQTTITEWAIVVRCGCGKVSVVEVDFLKNGSSDRCRSCRSRKNNTKHGGASYGKTRLYRVWESMRGRCLRSTHKAFKWYGARGITICESWDSFDVFRDWAHGSGYKIGLSIDRIDNDKGYFPENCQWISPRENVIKEMENRKSKASSK